MSKRSGGTAAEIARAYKAARLRRKTEVWSGDSGEITVTWDVPALGASKQLPPEARERVNRVAAQEWEKGPGPAFKQLPPEARASIGNGDGWMVRQVRRGHLIFRFTGETPTILTQ